MGLWIGCCLGWHVGFNGLGIYPIDCKCSRYLVLTISNMQHFMYGRNTDSDL